MAFPSLIAHQIYPRFFNLGGRLSPVSIRDQMCRAQMLVDDAIAAGLIGGQERIPLLVVGSGAAGAAAAIWAAEQYQVPTLLIDRDSDAFNRQANCRTRWIDPTQYDWPAHHWDRAAYPCEHVATPMPWSADLSHLLAAKWKIRLRGVRTPNLRVEFNTSAVSGTLIGPPGAHTGWQMTFAGALAATIDFGVVLWTVGFGAERCNFGDYVGFPFWETDPFEQPSCGLQQSDLDIVISGSGDGALQDFLRITTNLRSAKEILNRCGFTKAQLRRIEREVSYFDDLAMRGYLWGPGRRSVSSVPNDHDVLHNQYEAHRMLTRDLLEIPIVGKKLEKLIRKNTPPIKIIHSCDHFANAYGLNRFLALLVGQYLEQNVHKKNVFISGRRLAAIRHPNGIPCAGRARPWLSCHGKPHEIDLVEASDCRHDSGSDVIQTLEPNVLIIRHGINSRAIMSLPTITIDERIVASLPDIALPRQVTPYRALI